VALSQSQLKELARHGAAARIQELKQEIAAIAAAFPGAGGLRRIGKGGSAASPKRTSKRGHMSAAARKAASLRMKKYWAAMRAGKK
jgi:hypothetical protein